MMNRGIYSLILYLALPFVPIKLLWRGIKQPAYRQHWGERFGFYQFTINKPVIWLHCVSVGETRAAEPLIKALLLQYPKHQILISHGTPTGRETSNALFGSQIYSVYLPYDLPFAVNRFLAHFKPNIGLLMETELWFNLMAACKQRKIPLLLLNARLSEKSANGYAKLGPLVAQGMQNLSAVAAQSQDDATRFARLGAQSVLVTGNIKFDVKPPADSVNKGAQLRALLGNRLVLCAASTREGEEQLILDAVNGLDCLTIIVPRHPQRFDTVADMLKTAGIIFARKKDLSIAQQPISNATKVLLGDTMGELFTYYAASDFAFIGGSLVPLGGQNLIEAATMGKPILIGPHTFNFAEATKQAVAMGAAVQVENAQALRLQIVQLTENVHQREKMQQAALAFSATFGGATAKTMQLVNTYLK
jgi:3-deoxy-D-manno-octulosonic-acid transferase